MTIQASYFRCRIYEARCFFGNKIFHYIFLKHFFVVLNFQIESDFVGMKARISANLI